MALTLRPRRRATGPDSDRTAPGPEVPSDLQRRGRPRSLVLSPTHVRQLTQIRRNNQNRRAPLTRVTYYGTVINDKSVLDLERVKRELVLEHMGHGHDARKAVGKTDSANTRLESKATIRLLTDERQKDTHSG